MTLETGHYVAIDPLALLFRDLFDRNPTFWEKFHPHVDKQQIEAAAREMSVEQKRETLAIAKAMTAYSKAIEEVLEPMTK